MVERVIDPSGLRDLDSAWKEYAAKTKMAGKDNRKL